jgi:hypothetical protein
MSTGMAGVPDPSGGITQMFQQMFQKVPPGYTEEQWHEYVLALWNSYTTTQPTQYPNPTGYAAQTPASALNGAPSAGPEATISSPPPPVQNITQEQEAREEKRKAEWDAKMKNQLEKERPEAQKVQQDEKAKIGAECVKEENEKAVQARIDDAMKSLEQRDNLMNYGGRSIEPFPPLPVRKPVATFPVRKPVATFPVQIPPPTFADATQPKDISRDSPYFVGVVQVAPEQEAVGNCLAEKEIFASRPTTTSTANFQPHQAKGTMPVGALTSTPGLVQCPVCGVVQVTSIDYETGVSTHIWAVLCCVIFGLGCIPYLFPGFKDVQHKCGHCGALLATWQRTGGTKVHQFASL